MKQGGAVEFGSRPIHRRLAAALTAFLLLGLVACNTLPVGSGQLRGVPAVDSLTLEPDTVDGFSKYVPLGSADTMFLGQDEQYQSRILVKFWTDPRPDSALDSVTSARLVLFPADSTPMSFVCRPCSVNWFADAVSWRQAESTIQWLRPGGDYWDVELCRGTLSGESLVIDLDIDRLELLIQRSYGIILFPEDTGFCPVFSNYSAATSPRLELVWGDSADTRSLTSVEDAHIMDTVDVRTGPGWAGVGSGVAFRTYLELTTDSIPVEATISRADLVFRPDIEYARSDSVSISVRRLTQSYPSLGKYASFLDLASARLTFSPDSDTVATLDLRALAQFWTANPDSNLGLFIVAEPENARPFRFRIPVSGPGAPRLEVFYNLPPEGRFW